MFTKYEKIAIERGYKVLPNGICINSKGVEVGTKGTSKTNPYYSIWIRIDTKKYLSQFIEFKLIKNLEIKYMKKI